MDGKEIKELLAHLAVIENVALSNHNRLNAVVYFYIN